MHVPHLDERNPDLENSIIAFLERYGRAETDGHRRFDFATSIAILKLQQIINTLIADYCKINLTLHPHTKTPLDSVRVSDSELHRLKRAFWRYEIYSRLFSTNLNLIRDTYHQASDNEDEMQLLDDDEIVSCFFGLFPVHEVEELACLHVYASLHYKEALKGIDIIRGHKGDCVNILSSLGPSLLHRVLTARSQQEQAETISQSIYPITHWMRLVLDAYERVVDTGHWPWKGEGTRAPSDKSSPPTGWIWASSNGIANTDFGLRRWGYVFWDRERLDNWGITMENMRDWPLNEQHW